MLSSERMPTKADESQDYRPFGIRNLSGIENERLVLLPYNTTPMEIVLKKTPMPLLFADCSDTVFHAAFSFIRMTRF